MTPQVTLARASAFACLLACAACTSSMSSQARLSPTGGAGSEPSLSAQIERSCPLGECRTQRVRMVLSSGEVFEGEMRLLSSGLATDAGFGGGTPIPARRPAVMTLRGPGGSHLTCEVALTPDTRHGTGVCTSSSGVRYEIGL